MGDIKLGHSAIGSIKFSTQDVDKAYLGENLVYYKPRYDGNAVLVCTGGILITFANGVETHRIVVNSSSLFSGVCVLDDSIAVVNHTSEKGMHISIYDFALNLKDEILLPDLGSPRNLSTSFLVGGNGRLLLHCDSGAVDSGFPRVTFINLKDKIPHYYDSKQPNSGCFNTRYWYVENSDEFISTVQDTTDGPLSVYRLNETTYNWEAINGCLDPANTGCSLKPKFSYVEKVDSDNYINLLIKDNKNNTGTVAMNMALLRLVRDEYSEIVAPLGIPFLMIGRTYKKDEFVTSTSVGGSNPNINAIYTYNPFTGSYQKIADIDLAGGNPFLGMVRPDVNTTYILTNTRYASLHMIKNDGTVTTTTIKPTINAYLNYSALFIIKNQIN